MTYRAQVHAQDASTGRVGEVLRGIEQSASHAGAYTSLDAAVAYASRTGVYTLRSEIGATPGWLGSKKRFLVSIDFGITEPAALEALAALPNAEVRVPNGAQVLASANLMPLHTFHAKGYLFRGDTWASPSCLVVGSANMTVSALATGSEVVTTQAWTGGLSASDRRLLKRSAGFLDWFEDAWAVANPLATVLAAYRTRYRRRRPAAGPRIPEEETLAAQQFAAPEAANEVVGALAVQLAAARSLWVRTEDLYKNLRGGTVGNQLDTRRGSRVFFGFPANNVPRNTVLGYVEMQIPGFAPVTRSVRFGDNYMDKVNLPIPGRDGPPSYEHAYLIFDRDGVGASGLARFRLSVTDQAGLNRRKRAATNYEDLVMGGGRPYGLLF